MVSVGFARVDEVRLSRQHVSVCVCLQRVKTLAPAVYRRGGFVYCRIYASSMQEKRRLRTLDVKMLTRLVI